MEIAQIIKEKRGTLIDVRSYAEFTGGHVAGSLNIPLQEIPHRIQEIQELKTPLILFCASGNRSGQAQVFLTAHGIECYNGGSWLDVNFMQAQAE